MSQSNSDVQKIRISWDDFKKNYFFDRKLNFSLDVSLLSADAIQWQDLSARFPAVLEDILKLEAGAIANPDEGRMVGHYWLRAPELAPSTEIRQQIEESLSQIQKFSDDIHSGRLKGTTLKPFKKILIVGIGGSALGPQFVTQALRSSQDKMQAFFFDNTDPDGMQRVLEDISDLSDTLVITISKSGGTKETRNGQMVAKAAFEKAGLSVSQHFVAVTGAGSQLDKQAVSEGWLARFAMWDWVGGRTSELSAVGLLPAALQGFSIAEMLRGASEMDELTRCTTFRENPAALLSSAWYLAGNGRGSKDMVVLPYKDRLELFSKYLQQLVMESLGKERDLKGNVVNQGIAVYGNKGSTDQHAYVQQLRDGVNNFFAVFIEVLKASSSKSNAEEISYMNVEENINCADYLAGFLLGTRKALAENNRQSVTVTIEEVNEHSVGMLIALFERAVSFYASMVGINAYHQPGVEAGKKAATTVLSLQTQVLATLAKLSSAASVEQVCQNLELAQSEREQLDGMLEQYVFKIIRRLLVSGQVQVISGTDVWADTYKIA